MERTPPPVLGNCHIWTAWHMHPQQPLNLRKNKKAPSRPHLRSVLNKAPCQNSNKFTVEGSL